jgi:hypothetical protein
MATGTLAPNDEALIKAARRIVRQFDLAGTEQSGPIRVNEIQMPPASDPSSLRIIVDNLVAQVSHLTNLFAVRENTYEAVIERLERLVVTLEGRIDGLTADLDDFRRGQSLGAIAAADEIDQAKSSVAAELTPILEMCRTMISDAQIAQAAVVADIEQAVAALSASRER